LAPNFSRVLDEPNGLEARSAMQLGACLAGLAIENSMLGATHALANPLTAAYGIAHGEAIALMLPHVIRHNGKQVEASYRELAECGCGTRSGIDDKNAADALSDFVSDLSQRAGLAGKLKECNVPHEDLPKLAAAAAQQWTGKFNPVELTNDDYLKLYEAAF
jgi:alcohol dehydrogenase